MPPSFVRQVRAYETETVEIKWTFADGSVHYQRVTSPPKATVAAHAEKASAPQAEVTP